MKILETVTGSNHRLIQPHTVEKNRGAPIIKIPKNLISHFYDSYIAYNKIRRRTVESLRIVGSGQLTGSLHVALQVPEHAQTDVGNVDDVGAKGDWSSGMWAVGTLGRQRLDESCQMFVQRE